MRKNLLEFDFRLNLFYFGMRKSEFCWKFSIFIMFGLKMLLECDNFYEVKGFIDKIFKEKIMLVRWSLILVLIKNYSIWVYFDVCCWVLCVN